MPDLHEERLQLVTYLQLNWPEHRAVSTVEWVAAAMEECDTQAGQYSMAVLREQQKLEQFKANVRRLALKALLNEASSAEGATTRHQLEALLALTDPESEQ